MASRFVLQSLPIIQFLVKKSAYGVIKHAFINLYADFYVLIALSKDCLYSVSSNVFR